MKKSYFFPAILLLGAFLMGDGPPLEAWKTIMEKLRPLHKTLAKPSPGEWRYHHEEPGQTFEQYARSNPVKVDERRHTLYIQPLGHFNKTHRKIVSLTADFMERYFNLPVEICPDLPLSVIPEKARRRHPTDKNLQILSTYVLHQVLLPNLPKNAAAYIAFTTVDLWPGKGWNFVFGQASISARVGVWSLHRNGDPMDGREAFRLCLKRTIKTATHETGHIFSLLHCTLYRCNMCGSNSLEEADGYPMWLCPECLPKLCFATNADPVDRYRKLAQFCKTNGFEKEAAFYANALEILKNGKPPR